MTNKIFLLLSFMLLGVAINAKELQATSPAASFESSIQIKLIIDNYDVDLPLADLIYNDIAGILQGSIISAEHMESSGTSIN
jgi:hypothetical protein